MDLKKQTFVQTLVKSYFKDSDGKPYEMTPGECGIFEAVTNPDYRWVWASAPTRYGKTETIAIASIILASFYHLKVPIVGGSEDKAKKIMDYIINHVADHSDFYQNLINAHEFSQLEKLKVQVSKDVLRWTDGGWIFITSVESRSISKEGEGVVGEGGDVVILEEAGLIRNKDQFSKVVRMPEENKGWGKLVMAGNCIEKSVFQDAWNDPKFHKVRISLDQSIKEGRFTQDYLDQKKTMTTTKDWKRYYLVEFPKANEFTYFKPKKYEYLPTDLEYFGALDPALGESKKGSLVGIVVLGRSKKTGQVYEVESFGKQIGPDEATRVVFNLPHKFVRFGIEAVQFQKYFLKVIQEKSQVESRYIPFEGIEQKRKKEERIESLEPFINTGQILFKGDNLLWEHLQDYPDPEYFDILDTLEMAWRLISGGKVDFTFI
jgi:predicted phage terminase large subunit-like protein